MKATVIITDGDKQLSFTRSGILSLSELLSVYRDAAVGAGYPIGEVAADNDLGDVFWSDDEC